MVGGTALVREAAGEEDADLIKTENLAATTEYSQTPRYPSNVKHQVICITARKYHGSPRIAAVLRERREAGRCFTFVGDILIALNPAADDKNRGLVELESLQRGEPHIFSLTRCFHLTQFSPCLSSSGVSTTRCSTSSATR